MPAGTAAPFIAFGCFGDDLAPEALGAVEFFLEVEGPAEAGADLPGLGLGGVGFEGEFVEGGGLGMNKWCVPYF